MLRKNSIELRRSNANCYAGSPCTPVSSRLAPPVADQETPPLAGRDGAATTYGLIAHTLRVHFPGLLIANEVQLATPSLAWLFLRLCQLSVERLAWPDKNFDLWHDFYRAQLGLPDIGLDPTQDRQRYWQILGQWLLREHFPTTTPPAPVL